MLAVIKTGGKQYIVKPGDKLKIEKIDKPEGENVKFSEILLVEKDGKIEIGSPILKKAEVEAKIAKQGKGEKIVAFKYKSKKRYARKVGHRQLFTEIEITDIKA